MEFKPKHSVVEITYTCNLKCKHCASDLNSDLVRGEQLTTDEFERVFKEIRDLGGEHLILSGGEALLHKEWERLARYAVSLGFRVSIISNGMIIDREMAKRIKATGIRLVALSIDGNEEVHDYIRDNAKSYNRVLKAAQYLKEEGLKVNFITTVMKANINLLKEIEETICKYEPTSWLIQVGSAMGRLGRYPELVAEPQDIPRVIDYICEAKKRNKVHISVGDNVGYFSDDEEELRTNTRTGKVHDFCGCFAGCLVVGIESNGNVKGCLSLQDDRFIEGNVRNESLADIWTKKGNFAYTRDFDIKNLEGHCKECDYGEICRGGCSFMSYGATGALYNNPFCMQNILHKESC